MAVPPGDSSLMTLSWREQDSNHRSRVTRPIFQCPLWLVPANRKVGVKENRHTKRRALPPRNRWFESCSLQRRVQCEPNFSGTNPINDRWDFANGLCAPRLTSWHFLSTSSAHPQRVHQLAPVTCCAPRARGAFIESFNG